MPGVEGVRRFGVSAPQASPAGRLGSRRGQQQATAARGLGFGALERMQILDNAVAQKL